MRSEWETIPLPKCIDDVKIPVKIPRKQFQESGPFPIVSQEKDPVNGYWSEKSAAIHVETPLVLFGDHTQVLKFIDFDFVAGADGIKLLKPKSFLMAKYLYYFLMAKPIDDLGYARHYRLLKQLDVRFPPLAEQKRIVAILDEAFAGIATAVAHAQKNLANARELFESHLNAVFSQKGDGWLEKKVGEIADHSLGKMLDKRKNKGTLRPYLRNQNVRWFSFDLDDVLEMKFEDSEEGRYTASKGDVLVCEGGYPGRAAIWESDESVYFQKAIHRIRFRNPVHNRWFLYFIFLSDLRGDLRDYFTGAGIQHFTGKALDRFSMPIPPTHVVSELVERFDSLREEIILLEALYRRKLDALAELKQSILQKAFAGELTAQPDKVLAEAWI